jgi:hypothetical protein
VFSFEDRPDAVPIPYTFEPLRNTLHIWDIHRALRIFLFIQTTATLSINDRVNETYGITVELKIISRAADFIKQILSCLTYGGSSIVMTLNQTSFHMRRMVRVEVELSASVGGFLVHFCGQWRPFPNDQNIQERNHTLLVCFHSELDGRS